MVAKDAIMYRNAPVAVSLWSGDEGSEAQPKHSTRDKELIHSQFLFTHDPPWSSRGSSSSSSSLRLPLSPYSPPAFPPP